MFGKKRGKVCEKKNDFEGKKIDKGRWERRGERLFCDQKRGGNSGKHMAKCCDFFEKTDKKYADNTYISYGYERKWSKNASSELLKQKRDCDLSISRGNLFLKIHISFLIYLEWEIGMM